MTVARVTNRRGSSEAESPDDRDPVDNGVARPDHGDGGVTLNDHSEAHPLNWTTRLILGGGSGRCITLETAHLLDVPTTAACVLGVTPPDVYTGRALLETIVDRELPAAAAGMTAF